MALVVLRRQPSHLLLIRTNLGSGTVLTAACARQVCCATDYLFIIARANGEEKHLPLLVNSTEVYSTNFVRNMPVEHQ
jgi:hypothetical protein